MGVDTKPAAAHSFRYMARRKNPIPVLVLIACLMCYSTSAFAIDKRLKLMFKTAGYGAAAGLVIGAGTAALGMGGFRNVLMGTSAGMYAGILLAAYIVATPNEGHSSRNDQRARNPYAPRKPVGPDDYDEDDDGIERHLPPKRDDGALVPAEHLQLMLGQEKGRHPEIAVWAPLVSVQF